MSKIEKFIEENIDFNSNEAFFVFNVEDVIRKHEKWCQLMPRIQPFYSVKTNRFGLLLALLNGLGVKFDCASQYEIDAILCQGISASNIIYANPCKPTDALQYSKSVGVQYMTFDNNEELLKIRDNYLESKLILRIKTNDDNSSIKLSSKFGADMGNVSKLLSQAKQLGLSVVGIAFHVGSGCQSAEPYMQAIRDARIAFDMGLKLGFKMTLLDCGGGFPGSEVCYNKHINGIPCSFEQMANCINKGLDMYFPEDITFLAEPGRYYSESAFTLMTRVIGKNIQESNDSKTIMYYLNEGAFGSFLDSIVDKKVYKPIPILDREYQPNLRSSYLSILWGPTCDSYDCILKDVCLPEMNIGEWVMFKDMGAYTLPYAKFGFNGIPSPEYKIFITEFAEIYLRKLKNFQKIKSLLSEYKYSEIFLETDWYQMG